MPATEDRGPILELVRAWEGEQSAAIAARWLDRQPEGFFVIRDLDGEVRGMLAIVDLARSSLDDVDADPGARAAWDFAHAARHQGPARRSRCAGSWSTGTAIRGLRRR